MPPKELSNPNEVDMLSAKDVVIYLIGGLLLLIVGPLIMYYLATIDYMTFLPEDKTTFYLGGFTSAVGLGFAIWSNIELVSKGKGGAANIGPLHLMAQTKHLVTTGPYAICRNPMHLGIFLYYMGFSCALNALISLIVPLLFALFAYAFAVFLDEPRLERDFSEEFSVYRQKVPRFLPKVFLKRNP